MTDDAMAHLTPAQRELVQLWLESSAQDDPAPPPYAAPATPHERLLAEIWQEVLEQEPIGVDDDYFRLGGDSITAIVVIAKAQAAGLDLTTQDLLGLRTIRKIAEAVTAFAAPATFTEDGRLTPMQQGMLFDILSEPDRAPYVVQVSARLDGDIDAEELTAALSAVVGGHRALRMSIRSGEAGPHAVFHDAVRVPVETLDLRALPPAEQRAQVEDYLARDRERGFDLGTPPLLRLGLLLLGQGSCRLVLTHHHLLLDGWSQQIVLRDFLSVYDGAAFTPAAPAKVVHTQADSRYWRERLAGFTPGRTVPGRTGPATYTTVVQTLPEELARGLTALARRCGVTVPALLYGGWALMVAELAGRRDVAFGVTVSGRSSETDAVGMFINTLPLRIQVDRREPLLPWLSRVHGQHTDLLAAQHMSLPEIARCLPVPGPARDLFDTIVVVENFPQPVREGHASQRLRISEVTTHIVEGYPLVLEVNTASPVRLALRVDTAANEEVLARFVRYLRRLCAGVDERTTVGEVAEAMGRGVTSVPRQRVGPS
uniref:Long-chain-fatty-acid--CoA ligase n=1 Tax=uncultured bacterium esnapd14 TaxID=1366594 RepID=S5TMR2_9BACT|nr:long-chain-fatty-acid--CoA ligase [uncultured bacterium esnapd14]